jgi:DNA-binding NtrC family response regulator
MAHRRRAPGFGLPTHVQKSRWSRMNPGEPKEAGSAPAAILLVDDEPAVRDVLATALRRDFDVTQAASAPEAETLLQTKAFEVVITDQAMPGGSGLDLLIRTRVAYPEMRRILVTGDIAPEMLLRAVREAELFQCLLKPVALADLMRAARGAVQAHQASAAPRKQ